ncbi:MAG TPA: hypothetical protein VLK84_26715 [Longimicrobium sp.]|nr:hypothetical protein [Longimicrobium sp.]
MSLPYRTHAHVSEDGTLVLSNLPFAAGEQVEVTLRTEPSTEEQPAPEADALGVLEKLMGTVQAPSDWAAQHDHYLYGTPKRADPEP